MLAISSPVWADDFDDEAVEVALQQDSLYDRYQTLYELAKSGSSLALEYLLNAPDSNSIVQKFLGQLGQDKNNGALDVVLPNTTPAQPGDKKSTNQGGINADLLDAYTAKTPGAFNLKLALDADKGLKAYNQSKYSDAFKQCYGYANTYAGKASPDVAPCKYVIGKIYYYGYGNSTIDKPRALNYLKEAASDDFPEAQYELVELFAFDGQKTTTGSTALKVLKRLEAQGFTPARSLNLYLQFLTNSTPNTYNSVVPQLKKLTKTANGKYASYILGMLETNPKHLKSAGIASKNYTVTVADGIAELEKAAQAGHDRAAKVLGEYYVNGIKNGSSYILKPQPAKAEAFLKEAAKRGDVKAQATLAQYYFEGKDFTQNYKEAVNYANMAEKQGDAYSAYLLGLAYHKGYGVSVDRAKAVYYYSKSCEAGVSQACSMIKAKK